MATRKARPWQIRAARLEDAAEIARLTTKLGYPAKTDEIEHRLGELLRQSDHFIIVASGVHGHVFGAAMAERRNLLVCESQMENLGLVVGKNARRMGVGKALVGAVEKWALQLGVERIVVRSNVVRPESHPFYESIGYERAKTQHVYSKGLTTARHACA